MPSCPKTLSKGDRSQRFLRVVTRYMGSGIKGLKKGGIRDHSLGSGIKALGIGISVFSMGSRIRRLDFVGSGIKILITFGIRD